jgi:hypothetical protein
MSGLLSTFWRWFCQDDKYWCFDEHPHSTPEARDACDDTEGK